MLKIKIKNKKAEDKHPGYVVVAMILLIVVLAFGIYWASKSGIVEWASNLLGLNATGGISQNNPATGTIVNALHFQVKDSLVLRTDVYFIYDSNTKSGLKVNLDMCGSGDKWYMNPDDCTDFKDTSLTYESTKNIIRGIMIQDGIDNSAKKLSDFSGMSNVKISYGYIPNSANLDSLDFKSSVKLRSQHLSAADVKIMLGVT